MIEKTKNTCMFVYVCHKPQSSPESEKKNNHINKGDDSLVMILIKMVVLYNVAD